MPTRTFVGHFSYDRDHEKDRGRSWETTFQLAALADSPEEALTTFARHLGEALKVSDLFEPGAAIYCDGVVALPRRYSGARMVAYRASAVPRDSSYHVFTMGPGPGAEDLEAWGLDAEEGPGGAPGKPKPFLVLPKAPTAAKKAPARKSVVKKASAKKSVVKKASAKKSVVKKAPAKKTTRGTK